MRVAIVVLLVAVPWAACLGDAPHVTAMSVFSVSAIERGDPTPVPVRSCAQLLQVLNERALTQARVSLEQSLYDAHRRWWGWGGVAVESAQDASGASAPRAAQAPSAREAQVTGTNNQEAGADEADLVKTDGEWTYVFSAGILHILHSDRVGDIATHGRMAFPNTWGAQLLLERRDPRDAADDRLILVLPAQGPDEAALRSTDASPHSRMAGGMTRVVVLSLEDRSHPPIVFDAWVEGQSVGARLVDGTAYVVVHRWEQDLGLRAWAYPEEEDLRQQGLTYESFQALSPSRQKAIRRAIAIEADAENQERLNKTGLREHLPVILRVRSGKLAIDAIDRAACSRVLTTPDSTGRGFSTILALGVKDSTVSSSTTQVMGGRPIVYASEDALVLAAPSQDFWWFWAQPDLEEATDLQWLELDGLRVRPRASGRVAGIVQDSFGIDVEGDELRVATTTGTWGRWWLQDPEPMMNHVAVFEAVGGKLVPRGIVGGIAPGERIWSARFTPNRAYLVTFRQMDPLWVIDLSAQPKILGELEIPGVSTYIHPLDDDALLTIGLGPGPGGEGLDWGRLQVSLFDISDVREPRRADVVNLMPAGGYGWSSALHEHKAFTYWGAVETLAVPLTTQRSYEAIRGGTREHVNEYHVGLRLIDVNRDDMDLSFHGEVNQNALRTNDRGWGVEIQRSYFLGYPETGPVSVYAISPLGVTSHDLSSLRSQASVSFQAN